MSVECECFSLSAVVLPVNFKLISFLLIFFNTQGRIYVENMVFDDSKLPSIVHFGDYYIHLYFTTREKNVDKYFGEIKFFTEVRPQKKL